MNWLFITTQFPWPIVDGHWLRVYHLARTLRAGGDKVAVLSFARDATSEAAYTSVGVDVLPSLDGCHIQRGPGRVVLSPYAFDTQMAKAVAHRAAQCDVAVLSGARMIQYAPEAAASTHVLADVIDDPVLEFVRRENRVKDGLRQSARRFKNRIGRLRYERTSLAHIDTTVFVSEADCRSFQGRHPQACVVCVPNGVDADYFRRPEGAAYDKHAEATIVFTGHMSNPNNERAAQLLVREVAPLVWNRCPLARFQIVGADPTKSVLALASDRVEVTGRVDDIRPYLWRATVVALPMQSGTGIKNKLLEAWAAGAAVVASRLACQGVPAEHARNLLVAGDREEFATMLLSIVRDPLARESLGFEARQTVLEGFTWPVAADRLRRCVMRLPCISSV